MLDKIEKELERRYPKHWSRKNIRFFLGTERLANIVRPLDEGLNRPTRDIVCRGGKRVRPVLFLTLLQFFRVDYKKYLPYAYFIENIHNATLVLDDIEDGSQLRRGLPTCHIRYGLDTAVNVGASMHFLPLVVLLKKNHYVSTRQQLELFHVYSEELVNLHFGQATDIYWHKFLPRHVPKNQYLEMTRLKTGSLLRMAVRFACVLGNRSAREEKDFTIFAERAGIAFQIYDDLLDLVAEDRKKFGKIYGNDISEGKLSLPVILAMPQLDTREQIELRTILKMHTTKKTLVSRALHLIKKTNAIENADRIARDLIEESLQYLNKTKITEEQKKKLGDFVRSFIRRDA